MLISMEKRVKIKYYFLLLFILQRGKMEKGLTRRCGWIYYQLIIKRSEIIIVNYIESDQNLATLVSVFVHASIDQNRCE